MTYIIYYASKSLELAIVKIKPFKTNIHLNLKPNYI